jgi:hypothetical protein
LPAESGRSILCDAVRLLTRVSVLLLAVALVPLLRFIDIDACGKPSAAPYSIEGVSEQDSPGVVVDRKQNLRFVTRVRAASLSGRADECDDDVGQDWELAEASTGGWGPAASEVVRSVAVDVFAPPSAALGRPNARGPPA